MKTNTPDLSKNLKPTTTGGRCYSRAVRALWTIILLFACCGLGASEAPEYPIMQLTSQEMDAMVADYMSAPMLAASDTAPTFPDAMSLLSYLPYTPADRNQGNCGNCWQWAGVGVMEIAHAVQNGVRDRLSVQLINSCTTERVCCAGGGLQQVVNFHAGQGFAIPWSNTGASWTSGNNSCGAAPCGSIVTSPRYNLNRITMNTIPTSRVGQAQAIANIKSVLNQNKAVYFGFGLPDFNPFFSFWRNQTESAVWSSFPASVPNGTVGAREGWHAVLCVGYDDTDPNNRYWLMVNSWGTTSGRPNVLFRVAMNLDYDKFLGPYQQTLWQTLDVQFAGSVMQPEISVSAGSTVLADGQTTPVDFGTVAAGENGVALTFTVFNAGVGTLNLGAISVPVGYRLTQGLPATLARGEQNTFTILLEATTVGTRSGQVTIQNDDRDENPFCFPIVGRVYQPPSVVWVDGTSNCGNPNGTQTCPYRMVPDGHLAVARCGTVRIRTGTYQTYFYPKCALFEPYDGPVLLTLQDPGANTPNETPLKLSAPARRPDGSFAMQFAGRAGQRYRVLTSTDLVTWDLWKEFTAEADATEIVDDDAAVTPHRFFKVVMP